MALIVVHPFAPICERDFKKEKIIPLITNRIKEEIKKENIVIVNFLRDNSQMGELLLQEQNIDLNRLKLIETPWGSIENEKELYRILTILNNESEINICGFYRNICVENLRKQLSEYVMPTVLSDLTDFRLMAKI